MLKTKVPRSHLAALLLMPRNADFSSLLGVPSSTSDNAVVNALTLALQRHLRLLPRPLDHPTTTPQPERPQAARERHQRLPLRLPPNRLWNTHLPVWW